MTDACNCGALPDNGLFVDGMPLTLPAPSVVAKFDEWFYSCWCALPDDPRTAPSDRVLCCTYQQWFAGEGGPCEPLTALDSGRWSDCPDYVRHTAGISRECVRSLAGFRLSAHTTLMSPLQSGRGLLEPPMVPQPPLMLLVFVPVACAACASKVLVMSCMSLLNVRQTRPLDSHTLTCL